MMPLLAAMLKVKERVDADDGITIRAGRDGGKCIVWTTKTVGGT